MYVAQIILGYLVYGCVPHTTFGKCGKSRRTCVFPRSADVIKGVEASEGTQFDRMNALHTEAEAIEACAAHLTEAVCAARCRIAFGCDFRCRLDVI